ncbi:MAG: NAD(P)-binding domain-containing protein, partial [Acidimicrobiia bacterium]
MRIGVIGTGHVGLITSVSLSSLGHEVIATDTDEAKIVSLQSGETPFFEPGLDDQLASQLDSKRLRFVTELSEAVAGAEVVFICVGTPPRAKGDANLVAVES